MESDAALANDVQRVVGMMVNSSVFPVERVVDPYSATKTATATPHSQFHELWNVSGQSLANVQLDDDLWGAFFFRSALRAAVIHELNPSGNNDPDPNLGARYLYQWKFNPAPDAAVSGSGFTAETVDVCGVASGQSMVLDPNWALNEETNAALPGINFTWAPHGPVLFAGVFNGIKGIYMDAKGPDAQSTFRIASIENGGVCNSGSVQVELLRYSAGNWTAVNAAKALPTQSTIFNVAIDKSGYYAVRVNNQDDMERTFSVLEYTSGALGSSWAHKTVNQLYPNNVQNMSDYRCLAVNVHLRNVANELTKMGSLVAAQVSGREDWLDTYALAQNPGYFDYLFSVQQERDFELAKGYYGFIKPSSEHSLDFKNEVLVGLGQQVTYTAFRLDDPDDYLAVVASASTQGAGDLQVKMWHALEYKTRNTWADVRLGTVTPNSYQQAIQVVSTMQQHYENPTHDLQLWKRIFGTVGSVAKYTGPLLSVFGPYGAAAGAVLSAVGSGASALANLIPEQKERANDILKGRQAAEYAAMQVGANRGLRVPRKRGRFG
jgi:hypothetical protein